MSFWPLNDNHFTLLDKLKLSKFILVNDRWTQGENVLKFEAQMADYVGSKYAIFTSSGSTANTMLAMYISDKFNNIENIILPSTTWATSVFPFIREGLKPHFVDIRKNRFDIDYNQVRLILRKNRSNNFLLFPTSLLGFNVDIIQLKKIESEFDNVKIFVDNCEATSGTWDNKNISSQFTSTTSTYLGHFLNSIEGGFIFTNDLEESEYFKMCRNHGMVRHSAKYYSKDELIEDNNFRFDEIGSNFRNTEFNALAGLLDFRRLERHNDHRRQIYDYIFNKLNNNFIRPNYVSSQDVPFCLPILSEKAEIIKRLKLLLGNLGVEFRPIVGGNMLRHKCLRKFADYKEYPNSEFIVNNGLYIGLHNKVSFKMVDFLCEKINSL